MERITRKHLEAAAKRINILMRTPLDYMTNGKVNVGHYGITESNGGFCLVKITNEGGGEACIVTGGHIPARDLYNRVWAFIAGINAAQDDAVRNTRRFIVIDQPAGRVETIMAHSYDDALSQYIGALSVEIYDEGELKRNEPARYAEILAEMEIQE